MIYDQLTPNRCATALLLLAISVLHHHDPILNNRQNGWGSLPARGQLDGKTAFMDAGVMHVALPDIKCADRNEFS